MISTRPLVLACALVSHAARRIDARPADDVRFILDWIPTGELAA